MKKEILKLADLSNIKIGDSIWTIQNGFTKVIKINPKHTYSIVTNIGRYTIEGFISINDKFPSAFTKNPFKEKDFKERWMMVSEEGTNWLKRKVFMKKNGHVISWSCAETKKAVKKEICSHPWKYAMEIE